MILALKQYSFLLLFLWAILPGFCQDEISREPSLADLEKAIMQIVDKSKSCVVSIESCEDGKTKHSGVVIDENGHIVTVASSIKSEDKLCAKTNTGETFSCKIVGIDRVTNLAVLKIDGKNNLSSVAKGDSSGLKLGSFLVSIGNPFGLESSPSLGIVSGLERTVTFNEKLFVGLIQTTTAVNPGDAGGLTVDSKGRFVGLMCSTLDNFNVIKSTMIAPQGINFVIPSNSVYWVADKIIKHGKIERGRVGITVENGVSKGGVVIVNVEKGSPAYELGIEKGDRLVKINGEVMDSAARVLYEIYHTLVGEKITFQIQKTDNTVENLDITLERISWKE